MTKKLKSNFLCQKDDRFLCALNKKYLPTIRKWRNQQIDFLRQANTLSNHDQLKWWKKVINDKSQSLFSLQHKEEFIGYCGLVYIDIAHKRAEFSFLVDPSRAKNKTIYKEDFTSALDMVCQFGFENLKLNKIFIDTFEFRKNHILMIQEFGFRREATLKNHYFKRGKYCNSIIQSLFYSDWVKIKKKK